MERMGLLHVDIRLNDKVRYISPAQPDYEQAVSDLLRANHWMPEDMAVDTQAGAEGFMNHGMSRQEAESYYSRQRKIAIAFPQPARKNQPISTILRATSGLFVIIASMPSCTRRRMYFSSSTVHT